MKVDEEQCVPGMRGCVLYGRFVWSDESKNVSDALRKRRVERQRRKALKLLDTNRFTPRQQ